MPAFEYKTCPGAHGRLCVYTNRHRHGFWRYFFSALRCDCDCHKGE